MYNNALTIGQVASAAGVHVETIRYYQREALVTAPSKPMGGIRRYDDEFVARLKFIKRAQQLGFSLDEVRDLLRLDDGQSCHEARALAERKLIDVEAKLKDLRAIRRQLNALVIECHSASGKRACPLIEALSRSGMSR